MTTFAFGQVIIAFPPLVLKGCGVLLSASLFDIKRAEVLQMFYEVFNKRFRWGL
jgi:hypothetical protein